MNKLIAILTLLLCLCGLPALAQVKPETTIIPLRFADAASVARQLITGQGEAGQTLPDLPDSILLSVDAKTNSLIVTGDPDDLLMAYQLIQWLDVQPIQVRLNIRVIRMIHESNGALKMETISTPMIMTLSQHPATFSVSIGKTGYTLEINPQVIGDGTILLTGKLSVPPANTMKAENAGLVIDGGTIMLLGVTDSTSKETQRAVQHGILSVGGKEKHTDYYVQITATIPAGPPINQDFIP
ncbi:MAG TPA: secretin N-terminal domain-containing protein [Chthonomonadaceae bacterium]|nr:secretin N-terminal domain-containing protein [Chthonomonadaceae bacterium]